MKRVLVFGATSAIAEATARVWASRGDRLFLLGRDPQRLAAIAADLKVRGAADTGWAVLDALDFARHPQELDAAIDRLGGLDVALIAHGTLPDQRACEGDAAQAIAAQQALSSGGYSGGLPLIRSSSAVTPSTVAGSA